MAERRNSRRCKSFLRGFVYVSRKRGALSCLVRDFSDKGARIIFSDTVTLPDVVDLYIPQREQTIPRAGDMAPQRRDRTCFHGGRTPGRSRSDRRAKSSSASRCSKPKSRSLRVLLKRLKGEKADADKRSGGLTHHPRLLRRRPDSLPA